MLDAVESLTDLYKSGFLTAEAVLIAAEHVSSEVHDKMVDVVEEQEAKTYKPSFD